MVGQGRGDRLLALQFGFAAAADDPGALLQALNLLAPVGHHHLKALQPLARHRQQLRLRYPLQILESDHVQARVGQAHQIDHLLGGLEVELQQLAAAADFSSHHLAGPVVGHSGGKHPRLAALGHRRQGEALVFVVVGGNRAGQPGGRPPAAIAEHEAHLGTPQHQLGRNRRPQAAAEAIDQAPHRIDRHGGGATGDQQAAAPQGTGGEGAADRRY